MLRAGVLEDGSVKRSATGTPQGGVISPVLCNVYLHRLDRQWARARHRSADPLRGRSARDVQDQTGGRGRPRGALERSWANSAWNSSTPRRGSCICAKEARDSISSVSITATCAATSLVAALHVPGPLALASGDAACPPARLGRSPRANGCAPRRGDRRGPQPVPGAAGRATSATETPPSSSTRSSLHAVNRLVDLRGQPPQRDRRFGRWDVARQSPKRLGLIDLNGIIVPPRPTNRGTGLAECRR